MAKIEDFILSLGGHHYRLCYSLLSIYDSPDEDSYIIITADSARENYEQMKK